MKPRLLDLFARAQGTSVGYARAGFSVTASDKDTYSRHPEVDAWITADALEVLEDVDFCRTFDLITASPPCQGYSVTRHMTGRSHPMLIEPVRQRLEAIGKPYVIENVEGARWALKDPAKLCGSMFGLGAMCQDGIYRQLRRHRLFESSHDLRIPEGGCAHSRFTGGVYGQSGNSPAQRGYKFLQAEAIPTIGVYGHGKNTPKVGSPRGYSGDKDEAATAMGIDWMRRDDLSQAIPPVYTQWIGWWLKRFV